jgi:uncharacterized protein YacL
MENIIIILVAIAIIQLAILMQRTKPTQLRSFKARPLFIDTSVLMDGRIITAASTGFIGERLVIPRSVVAELQLLADKADADKRTRARRGLDVIEELQNLSHIDVEIMADGPLGEGGVDTRLLELAKKYNGHLCTIDFNLNKVAKVEKIFVLNINELAQSLRMAFLPGEKISIELVQKGQDAHQAVGYLADGTMVVVEQAAKQVGQTVEIEFIRSLQTAAGRMMFAKKVELKASERSGQKHVSHNKNNKSSRKPKTSAAREASLIELVNKQD